MRIIESHPFNRTSVELKPLPCTVRRLSNRSFNRTSVELKHDLRSGLGKYRFAFNRTSVELKLLNLSHVWVVHFTF